MKKIMGKFNKHLFPLLTALVLLVGLFPSLSVSAAWSDAYDFTSMPYSVELGADFNYVHFAWPPSQCVWTICTTREPNVIVARSLGAGSIDFTFKAGESYIIRCYPFSTVGFSLESIPDGTSIGMAASFDAEVASGSSEFDTVPSVKIYGWLKDRNSKSSSRELYATYTLDSLSEPFSAVMTVDSDVLFSKVAADSNSIYNCFIPMIAIDDFVASYSVDKSVKFSFLPSNLVLKIPSSYWVQFQNDMLDAKLELQMEELLTQFFLIDAGIDAVRSKQDAILQEIYAGFSSVQSLQRATINGLQFEIQKNGELVVEKIESSAVSVNNNIDLSKVEILNAIADMNNSIVTGTPEMDNIAQDSNQNLSNSSDKLDSLGDQLASVTKPNVEELEPSSPEQIVSDPNAGVILSGPITSLWDNPVIFGIVTTVLTLVLLSWVFFGKK